MSDAHLHSQPRPDGASTRELRAAVVTARHRLLDILHTRALTLASIGTWHGPHRERYETDAAELLAVGRSLAQSLDDLTHVLDAELAAAEHARPPGGDRR